MDGIAGHNSSAKKRVNMLITSAGKRVSLVRIFQKELNKYFGDARVYTTDMNPQMAPAGMVSEACFKVPRVTDAGYVDELIRICLEHSIAIIVPTIDTELPILAENKSKFLAQGITVLVPDLDFVWLCRDKRRSATLFQQLNIRIPEPRDKYHPIYPMFAKPFDGSLSKDLHIIRGESDLTPEILNNPKLIFMEYIDKNEYKEFTVDMYFDKNNRLLSIVPRERIEIRAGEINKGITRKNDIVDFLKTRMAYMAGVVGCICLQLFYRERDNDIIAIEINPRFGGGYPLSYYAGANYPSFIIREYLKGEDLSYSCDWKDKTLMLRYDDEIIKYGEV